MCTKESVMQRASLPKFHNAGGLVDRFLIHQVTSLQIKIDLLPTREVCSIYSTLLLVSQLVSFHKIGTWLSGLLYDLLLYFILHLVTSGVNQSKKSHAE